MPVRGDLTILPRGRRGLSRPARAVAERLAARNTLFVESLLRRPRIGAGTDTLVKALYRQPRLAGLLSVNRQRESAALWATLLLRYGPTTPALWPRGAGAVLGHRHLLALLERLGGLPAAARSFAQAADGEEAPTELWVPADDELQTWLMAAHQAEAPAALWPDVAALAMAELSSTTSLEMLGPPRPTDVEGIASGLPLDLPAEARAGVYHASRVHPAMAPWPTAVMSLLAGRGIAVAGLPAQYGLAAAAGEIWPWLSFGGTVGASTSPSPAFGEELTGDLESGGSPTAGRSGDLARDFESPIPASMATGPINRAVVPSHTTRLFFVALPASTAGLSPSPALIHPHAGDDEYVADLSSQLLQRQDWSPTITTLRPSLAGSPSLAPYEETTPIARPAQWSAGSQPAALPPDDARGPTHHPPGVTPAVQVAPDDTQPEGRRGDASVMTMVPALRAAARAAIAQQPADLSARLLRREQWPPTVTATRLWLTGPAFAASRKRPSPTAEATRAPADATAPTEAVGSEEDLAGLPAPVARQEQLSFATDAPDDRRSARHSVTLTPAARGLFGSSQPGAWTGDASTLWRTPALEAIARAETAEQPADLSARLLRRGQWPPTVTATQRWLADPAWPGGPAEI